MTWREHIKPWLNTFRTAAKHWTEGNAFAYSGALAFYTLFSVAPVVIMAVAIIGLFFGEDAARAEIITQIESAMGPKAAEVVASAVERSEPGAGGWLATLAGLGAMLIGATTVFGQMQGALNVIWSVKPKPNRNSILRLIKQRLLSLTVVLAIGFILLVSLAASVALGAFIQYAEPWLPVPGSLLTVLENLISLLMITALFATIFKVLPDVQLTWRDVLPGAVLTAIMFIIGRSLIAAYLAYSAPASAYGAAGSLVLLLLWVNYSSLILIFGAAFVRARLEELGRDIKATRVAVRIRHEFIESND